MSAGRPSHTYYADLGGLEPLMECLLGDFDDLVPVNLVLEPGVGPLS